MAKAQLHVGVFQGYEFAWAQQKYPDLKPLAVAVNVYRYPIVYVIARRDGPAKSFGDLRGKTLGVPAGGGARNQSPRLRRPGQRLYAVFPHRTAASGCGSPCRSWPVAAAPGARTIGCSPASSPIWWRHYCRLQCRMRPDDSFGANFAKLMRLHF